MSITARWKWEERIVSIILLLPFIWLFIWPVVFDQVKLHRTVPTDEIVKKFVRYENAGSTEVLDTSIPIACAIAIAAGTNHSLALKGDGTV